MTLLLETPNLVFNVSNLTLDKALIPSQDDMKSISAYVFIIGSSVFSWNSKKQETIAQLIVEVEYISVVAVNQTIWLKKILKDLNQEQAEATEIYCDTVSYCNG